MINFIRTSKKGHILGLFLLVLAGILAGCSAMAETPRQSERTVQQREVVRAAQTPDDDLRMRRNPYSEAPQDGDWEYPTTAPQKTASINLTKAAFNKIKAGMTLTEVEKMMGEKGMLVSTMDVNGRQTQIYKWSNEDFSRYIDVTIEKNLVVEKKDKGLK
jgi:hypothetical protein